MNEKVIPCSAYLEVVELELNRILVESNLVGMCRNQTQHLVEGTPKILQNRTKNPQLSCCSSNAV